MNEKIFNDVITIIEKYAVNKSLVKQASPSSKIITDLKINSARIVDIILDIEEKYNITIEDAQLEKVITINDIVGIIIGEKRV